MIKYEHKEIPATHFFCDGSRIRYYRSAKDGKVWGQLIDERGRKVRSAFTYLGDTA